MALETPTSRAAGQQQASTSELVLLR